MNNSRSTKLQITVTLHWWIAEQRRVVALRLWIWGGGNLHFFFVLDIFGCRAWRGNAYANENTHASHIWARSHTSNLTTRTHTRTIKLFRWRKDWVRNVKFAAMRKDRYGERSSGRARICAWVRRRHVFSYFVTPEVKFNFAKGLFLLTADTWCYGSTTNSLYTADRQQREGQCVCVCATFSRAAAKLHLDERAKGLWQSKKILRWPLEN